MIPFFSRAVRRIRDWAARRPVPVLVSLALLGAAGAGTGGYYAYRTYDWVEHDNDFCLSCHLMQEPHELFAQSDHRGLGCKACHKPTFAARSQMALTQIIENPDTIATHAEVPNEKCAGCHIEGDPEEWENVASSAGHRVHLESDDPSLDGLQCVECHSTGLHEFASNEESCGQSECHADIEVQLGRMSQFAIHCAACHNFSAPLPDTAGVTTALAALAPTQSECLSCHVMRTLVDMPPDEPHGQVCATCHNPHTQATPAAAVESCATSGCHDDVQELTAFHRGLEHPVVQDCSQCHQAHEFELTGDDCLSCHQDIFDDPGGAGALGGALGTALPPGHPTSAGRSPPDPTFLAHPAVSAGPPAGPAVGGGSLELHPSPAAYRHVDAGRAAADVQTAPRQEAPTTSGLQLFRHGDHRIVACSECHSTAESHGAITVLGLQDCRSCHHTAPAADACASCHDRASLERGILSAAVRLDFSVAEPEVRTLPFDHARHPDEACGTCHQDTNLSLPVDPATCSTCHEDHHEPTARCVSCHLPTPEGTHTMFEAGAADVHETCSGAGCHESLPFEGVPQDRNSCLVCHQDLQDHRPGQECVACHALPGNDGALP